jgi:hypothetical protein
MGPGQCLLHYRLIERTYAYSYARRLDSLYLVTGLE